MTEQLPITINLHAELIARFSKIQSVCNKLEAQFNFQTMTENWYGDEENVLTIELLLETPDSLLQHQTDFSDSISRDIEIKSFSDDVFCLIDGTNLQLHCYIAMTHSELDLLDSQSKLLTGLVQAKLLKVLNLIAERQSLSKI